MLTKAKKRYLPSNQSEGGSLTITGSRGSLMFDSRRRAHIDFTAGWCVGNLGWGRNDMTRAIRAFRGPAYVSPDFDYEPWADLTERLLDFAPRRLGASFRATGGSEAVEIALQAAMLHTGRRKFVSIEGSYHGNTIASYSVGDSESRDKFPNLLPGCQKIAPPLDAKALGKVETLLRKRDVAGFIMEPVILNLGVIIPEAEFMRGLQKLCRRYGTLLIIDEVATGFGRTGTLFGCERFNLQPDILCLAKAITAGYAPMGATLTTRAVAKSMQEVGAYSTYGWHPLSVAVALANLAHWKKHGPPLLAHADAIRKLIERRLSQMKFRKRIEVRAAGLAIAVDVGSESYASTIEERCGRGRLHFATSGSALTFFPALTIDRATANKAMDILQRSL
jgi:adenosylmethionine-8-amino-7-oxononanoate aminotransferase